MNGSKIERVSGNGSKNLVWYFIFERLWYNGDAAGLIKYSRVPSETLLASYHSGKCHSHNKTKKRTNAKIIFNYIAVYVLCWLPKHKLYVLLIWITVTVYNTTSSVSCGPVLLCYKQFDFIYKHFMHKFSDI
jgi:hypothetical protein